MIFNIFVRFIPRLYRNFMGNNHEYLLTEACLSGDMFTYLEEKGPMQCKSAMFVIACVISALDYLHNVLRCLHRDVKTENLLIGYAGILAFRFLCSVNYRFLIIVRSQYLKIFISLAAENAKSALIFLNLL